MNIFKKIRKELIVSLVLATIYSMFLIGLNLPQTLNLFKELSIIVFVIGACFLFYFHNNKSKEFYVFLIAVFCIGFFIEVLGVSTGFPFGNYSYTPTLKFLLFKVPIIIGINWVVLSYAIANALQGKIANSFLRIGVGSLILVGIDILLEHFAIKHNLWIWHNMNYPSITNFIAWFVIGSITQLLYLFFIRTDENSIAKPYLIILFLFLLLDFLVSFANFS